MLVGGRSLDAGLRCIREETARNPEENLGSNDATVSTDASAVVDHKTQGDQEKQRAEQDERLEAPHPVYNHADDYARQCGTKAVQGGNAVRCLLTLIEGDSQDREQEISLATPC